MSVGPLRVLGDVCVYLATSDIRDTAAAAVSGDPLGLLELLGSRLLVGTRRRGL